MAVEVGININVDGSDGQKSLRQLEKESKKTAKTFGDLEEEAAKLNEELRRFEPGSKDFNQVAKRLQQVNTEIKDIELSFESLDFEGRLSAFNDLAGGVAGGFAAVQGATALLVGENEELEKTLLKVNAAIAIAVGVRDIGDAVSAFKKLNVITKVYTATQKVLNFVLNANPIGIIVTAIAALVGLFAAAGDSVRKFIRQALGPLIAPIEAIIDGIKQLGEFFGLIPSAADRAAKAAEQLAERARRAAVTAEREKVDAVLKAEKEKRQERTEAFDFEIAKLQAAGKETFEVEQEKLRFVIESIQRQRAALQEQLEFETKLLAKRQATFKNSIQENLDFDANLAKIRIKNANEELEQIEELEKTSQEQITINEIKETKKRNDEARKLQEERLKEEARLREEAHKKELEEIERRRKERADLEKQIEDDLAAAEAEAEAKRQAQAEAQLSFNEFLSQQRLGIADKELESEEDIAAAKLSIQNSVVQGLGELNNILIRDQVANEKVQKALTLTQIGLDTAAAISALVKNSEANPANIVTGGLAGVAQFASGLVRILTNIGKAVQILRGSGTNASAPSAGGTGGGGGSVPQNINPAISGSTLIPQDGQQVPRPSKVFVVESDITGVQNGVEVIESQATID